MLLQKALLGSVVHQSQQLIDGHHRDHFSFNSVVIESTVSRLTVKRSFTVSMALNPWPGLSTETQLI